MNLIILFKNGVLQHFSEKDIDCSVRTIRGHANDIILKWKTGNGVHAIDNYNCVLLDEILSIRVS